MKKLPYFLHLFISQLQFAQKHKIQFMIRKFYDEALVNGQCYENLRYLCKSIGPSVKRVCRCGKICRVEQKTNGRLWL
jgi:hypothetical protein